jgi:hypothetical protein
MLNHSGEAALEEGFRSLRRRLQGRGMLVFGDVPGYLPEPPLIRFAMLAAAEIAVPDRLIRPPKLVPAVRTMPPAYIVQDPT